MIHESTDLGELASRKAELTKLYKNIDTDIDEELTCDLIGDYLFTDKTFIDHLTGNEKLFKKVWNEVKYLCKVATGKELTEIEKVQREFEKAWEELSLNKALDNEATENGTVKYSYAGGNSKTSDISLLTEADNLLSKGVDSETIRKKTGWYKGYDGKWRYEIDDSKFEFHPDGQFTNPDVLRYRELQKKFVNGDISKTEFEEMQSLANNLKGVKITPDTLGDVVSHDELFKAYPQLKDVKFTYNTLKKDTRGFYSYDDKAIVLNNNLIGDNETIKSTLIHEIQHAIQDIEGFASGASVEYWQSQREDIADTIRGARENLDLWLDDIGYSEFANKSMQEVVNKEKTLKQHWKDLDEFKANSKYAEQIAICENELAEFQRQYDEITHGMTAYEQYRNTAGEIEARNAENRLNLTTEERRNTRPDIDRENAVFADENFSISKEDDGDNIDSSLQVGLSYDTIVNNKNYAEGENNGNQNTESLAGREVSTVGGSENGIRQQSENSRKLAEYLGILREAKGQDITKCRAGESGWLLRQDNQEIEYSRSEEGLLRAISGIKPSGKDTAGRIISSKIAKAFKNTIFKDENGNLLSLYHWTTETFEKFAKGEFGFHFGTLQAARDRYIQTKETKSDTPIGNYKEVYLNVTNPLFFDVDAGQWCAYDIAFHLVEKGIITEKQYDLLSITEGFWDNTYDNPAAKAVRGILDQSGYDGVIYKNDSEDVGSYSVIALYPEQILTVAENGLLKENSGVIDNTNQIAPIKDTSSKDGVFSLSKNGEQIAPTGNYSTPLNETALAPTKAVILENENIKNVLAKNVVVNDAPMPSDVDAPIENEHYNMPDDYAPMTEEEANALQDELFNSITDADAPPIVEDNYYNEPDTTRLDDKALKGITAKLRETLSLTAKEAKV